MDKVIVYNNEFGTVAICNPTGLIPIEEVQANDIPEGVESFIIDRTDLPTDYTFIDAWVQTNGVVTVDFNRAKELTKNRLRLERTPLLAAQDVLFQRAQESGADTTAIVAEKNRLRDITNLVDTCTTLEQLKLLKV